MSFGFLDGVECADEKHDLLLRFPVCKFRLIQNVIVILEELLVAIGPPNKLFNIRKKQDYIDVGLANASKYSLVASKFMNRLHSDRSISDIAS